ncbi:MAG TPA: hypothetical protein VMH02_12095, partial [Verrucomicrobiae bacterium]|nr:hypothetical protein [Verrucomicrobiae bacterium]
MMDRRRIIVVSVFVVALVAACAGGYLFKAHRAAAAGSIAYVPISSSVFVNPAVVAQWAKTHNEAAVARHAVTLWNGLTAPTNESFNGVRLAVYDTWYTPCEIYGVSKDCGNGEI